MRRFLGLLAVAVVLAGCSGSVSVGDKTVNTDELESKVSAFVTKQLDAEPSKVDCPDDLDAKAKATTLCKVTVGDITTTVRLTVTKVDDGKASFDVLEVAADGSPLTTTSTTETPATTAAAGTPVVAPAELESQLDAQLKAQFGAAPDALTCPDGLEGTVGATTTCVLTDGAETYDVLLTTKTVDGLDVNFDFKVADTPN
ncbi:DUF4333 domain-containing protein [soil metagenome]